MKLQARLKRKPDRVIIARQSLIIFAFLITSGITAYAAMLEVIIDVSDQRLTVTENVKWLYSWPISTGRSGYRTPLGHFKPVRLERVWYSRKYDYAPMPHAIFFYGGYAIHGTTEIKRLGRPASHGCIRLHPDHARTLFDLVNKRAYSATRIRIGR